MMRRSIDRVYVTHFFSSYGVAAHAAAAVAADGHAHRLPLFSGMRTYGNLAISSSSSIAKIVTLFGFLPP